MDYESLLDPLQFSDVNLYVARLSNKELVFGYDAINQNIFLIVLTPIRSKWFRPRLGSNVPAYLFEPMDDLTASRIRGEIQTLLERNFENRVKINAVRVTPDYTNQLYVVEISYVAVNLSNEPYILRFGLNRQAA
jgi:phage baseplate assembly protein W